MNRYRIYLVSAVAILILVSAAMLWIGSERYYPQVNVAFPDHSELVFIDVPWTSEQKCRDANNKVAGAIGKNCSQCQLRNSCARQINLAWQSALAGQPIKTYVVHSGTLRILVNAGNDSKQTCIVMAEQITLDKKQTARCVFPL
ncbi:hypothetical protein [Gallionella capsiferriformans]|jgi:hypothetical protein|uniref:Uncharacterized protein n=1 Tax=Gallionella capsiferriformans (strain ES-2) TaxID=395494 RepID=D9SFM7_GALCS|nr:hypothetical protein [Gallionella capsiferriformans]ADL55324.1 hypothetical protein Galf_1297 [Gallionella capsiferriformans ES-2]